MITVMFIVEKLNFAQEFLDIQVFFIQVRCVVVFTISDVLKDVIAFICSAKVFQMEA